MRFAAKGRTEGSPEGLYEPRVTNHLEPVVGIEPTTYGLRNRCSTTELHRQGGHSRIERRPVTRQGPRNQQADFYHPFYYLSPNSFVFPHLANSGVSAVLPLVRRRNDEPRMNADQHGWELVYELLVARAHRGLSLIDSMGAQPVQGV